MGFTVIHEGETPERLWRRYDLLVSRLLMKRGINLDCVPLAPSGANGLAPLYVWDSEAEANALAEQLREQTEDPAWRVHPLNGQPRLGPFRPLEIRVGMHVDYWHFGLDPLTWKSLRMRYPNCCARDGVTISWEYPPGAPSSLTEVQSLAIQILPILTGLSAAELRPFGG